MAIPQHTIDQILDRTDLVELIGQRVKLKKQVEPIRVAVHFIKKKALLSMYIETRAITIALAVRPTVMPSVF